MSVTLTVGKPPVYCAVADGDAWLQSRVEAARDLVLEELETSPVEGLILTGSLARGEASVLCEHGRFRILGDVEFLLIVRAQPQWREFRRRLHEIGRRATERLSEGGSEFPVEYTPADISYLRRRARPSAFTWDLRQHGRVLHGRRDLLDELPAFARSAIPPEDAVETLMNRGLELLAAREAGLAGRSQAYAVVKTLVDMAGSALAFAGAYESLTARRPHAFRELLSRRDDLVISLNDSERLAALIDDAAALKLQPTANGLEDLAAAADIDSALRWILELWRWEVGQMVGRPSAPTEELVRAYLADEPFTDRFRGWAKYAWHPLRPASARLGPGLLRQARRGSPRRLVYSAAVCAIEGAEGWEERARRFLPAAHRDSDRMLQEIIESWTWFIRNN